MGERPVRLARSRYVAIAPFWIVATLCGAPAASSPDADAVCLNDGIQPSATARLIAEAVAVLEQSGHEPASYRLELRMEDASRPDEPSLSGERLASVVFEPVPGSGLYPLRIHPSRPCVATWVWQPDRLTPWQHEVLARARERLDAPQYLALEADDLRVMETQELVRVELIQSDRRISVTLAKADLAPVEATRGSELIGP